MMRCVNHHAPGKQTPPYQLVPHATIEDVVATLEQLLADAREGQLIGIAFAAMYRKKEYMVDTAGEASRNPTFARGMLGALEDKLAQSIGSRKK